MDFEDLKLLFDFEVKLCNKEPMLIDRKVGDSFYVFAGAYKPRFYIRHKDMMVFSVSDDREPIAHISQYQKVFDYLGI